ncbi:MAG: beta-lactamase family protein [Clostridia bacterium]|nr:beta-lactamase family protein [Clostridia bacterium]MBQ6931957.1 beta-lactamase family protein [Clostridia bacterium]MBQ7101869.1 beta-lactamase family protein [Clostridia bacterium]
MSRFLEECMEYIETLPFRIIRLTEIHNGVSETDEDVQGNPCQNAYSVAKAFTMTAIGLLYDKGLLRTDEKLCDILADELPESGMDERWQNVTVDLLLRHRAGLPGGFLDIDTHKSSEFTEDYLKYTLTYPLAYTPDTEERYSDGAYYLLSCIVEKKSGLSLDDFMWKELLHKLDFQEMAWSHCPKGHAMGATGLYIHSADMAKLGLVYLNKGIYGGERVLSEEWCNIAVERGYAFEWDESRTIYFKGGMCGQKLIVAPAQNRVVALQAYGANSNLIANFVRDYKD